MVSEYKVSAIKQSDINSICGYELTRDMYDMLYDIASYKKDERLVDVYKERLCRRVSKRHEC